MRNVSRFGVSNTHADTQLGCEISNWHWQSLAPTGMQKLLNSCSASVTPDKHMHTRVHARAPLLLEGWCFACFWLVDAASAIFWWLADLTCTEFPAEQAVLLLYFRPAPPASPLFIMWTESALECLPVSATSSVFSRDVRYTWMLFT